MARGDERFAWALSFLDLFTCALGGVFMLTILSVRQRDDAEANDPSGYLFLSAHYDAKPLGQNDKVTGSLPQEFQGTAAAQPVPEEKQTPGNTLTGRYYLKGEKGQLLVVAARLPYDAAPKKGATGTIHLPRRPDLLRYGSETTPFTTLRKDEVKGPIQLEVQGCTVTVDWAPDS